MAAQAIFRAQTLVAVGSVLLSPAWVPNVRHTGGSVSPVGGCGQVSE